MDEYKDRILNIGIIICIIFVLFTGLKIGYTNYINSNNKYNENIVDYVIKVEQGNIDLEDIESANLPEKIKQSLKEYYKSRFYSVNEKIEIPINTKLIDEIYENREIYKEQLEKSKLKVNDKILRLSYEDFVYSLVGDIEEYDGFDESDIEFCKILQSIFLNKGKTTKIIEIKDGKIQIYPESYINLNREIYYKGVFLDVIEIEKKTKTEVIENPKVIKIENSIKEKNTITYNMFDELNNNYSIKASLKKGKIVEIEFLGF